MEDNEDNSKAELRNSINHGENSDSNFNEDKNLNDNEDYLNDLEDDYN